MRAGEAEIELVARIELEDEGVGQGTPDLGGVQVAAIGSTARPAKGVPVVVERFGALFLHRRQPISKPRPASETGAPRRPVTLSNARGEIALKPFLRLMSAAWCE